jgi:long-chain acyl-CoA synthetase
MTNLAANLEASATTYPDEPSLRLHDTTLTFAEFNDLAGRAAGRMVAMGIRPGDRVGIMLPNVLEFPVLFYGALRLGAIAVPMNPLLKGREIAHYTGDSGMVLLWAHPSVAAEDTAQAADGCRVEQADAGLLASLEGEESIATVEKDHSDTAVVLYTSGTTGTPKGAELTHGGLDRNVRVCTEELMSIGPGDVTMGCLPLFHVFGLTCALNSCVAAGALLTLVPRFDPQLVLDVMARDKVTIFMGVPTMYTALASVPDADPSAVASLRVCSSGGAALPGEVLRAFEEKYGAKILEGYGLSETSPVASFNRIENSRVGSIGTPIPGVEFRVVGEDGTDVPTGEPGEIWIRGHNVMKGYWNRPEATAEAIDAEGWFKSGDIGKVDDDGFYYIVDRKKELIIRGGFNVYPREVEEVLYEHPAVREAAVIGLPHGTHGEEVGAAVSLKPGADLSVDELRAYVKERVAPYKYPRVVWFLDDLPKGATGKILKRAIEKPAQVQ